MDLYKQTKEDIVLHVSVSNGLYTITPPAGNPFTDMNYVVNVSCQVEAAYATARVVNSTLTATSFQIMTYVGTVITDCIFNFTVVN